MSQTAEITHKGCRWQASCLNVMVRVLGRLPFGVRSALGRAAGYLFSLAPTKERLIAAMQLALFMKSQGGARHLRRMYASLGQTLFEAFNLEPVLRCPERYVDCPKLSGLAPLLDRRRPVVALVAHSGNWDMLAAFVIRLGVPLSTVGRTARNEDFQAVLCKIREAYGIRTIWRDDSGSAKAILKEFKEKRVIAALIDQDTRVTSVFSNFFGRPVKTPSALVTMAKRADAAIITALIFRTGFNRYTAYFEEIDNSLSEVEILTVYHRRLEEYLRRHPEQWVWVHKRWRSTLDGRTMSSDEYLEFLRRALADGAG